MSALWSLGPQISHIPRMTGLHTLALGLGSSILSNYAFLALPSPFAAQWGAAPVVAGLAGACSAETLWLFLSKRNPSQRSSNKLFPALILTAQHLAGSFWSTYNYMSISQNDLVSSEISASSTLLSFAGSSYPGNAAATLFGMAYYYLFLRPSPGLFGDRLHSKPRRVYDRVYNRVYDEQTATRATATRRESETQRRRKTEPRRSPDVTNQMDDLTTRTGEAGRNGDGLWHGAGNANWRSANTQRRENNVPWKTIDDYRDNE